MDFKVKHTHTQSPILTHTTELAERKLGSFHEIVCVCFFSSRVHFFDRLFLTRYWVCFLFCIHLVWIWFVCTMCMCLCFILVLLYHAWIKCVLNLFQCTLLIHGNKFAVLKTHSVFSFSHLLQHAHRKRGWFYSLSFAFLSFASSLQSLWWEKHKFYKWINSIFALTKICIWRRA